LTRVLTGGELYPHFDPETMELLKFDGDALPQHYKVDGNGTILEKTFREKVLEGLVPFSRDFLTQAIEPVRKAEDDDAKPVTEVRQAIQAVNFGIEAGLIQTEAARDFALKMLIEEFEQRIAIAYSPGREIKITKDLVEWLYEERPPKDPRKQTYQTMKADIQVL